MRITVLTPTFNRERLLPRVYESLRAQTCRSFEWIVVDDGSSDQTRDVVGRWKAEAGFPVTYLYQENRGKHIACNRGIAQAAGEFVLIADSDDGFVPEALQILLDTWDSIPDDQKPNFTGVTGRCQTQEGKFVGNPLPSPVLDSDNLELQYKYRVRGEKWGMNRTDLLRRFPFAETPVVGPFPWGRIAAAGFKTRYIEQVLRIYYVDNQQQDNLSKVVSVRQPMVNVYVNAETLNVALGWFWTDPRGLFKAAVNLCRFGRAAGLGLGGVLGHLERPGARVLVTVAYPLSGFFRVAQR